MGISLRCWLVGGVALFLSQLSLAAGTGAGTTISNTATATFTDGGGNPQTVNSNTTNLTVDELLDVTLVSNDAGSVSVSVSENDAVLSFTVTNTGNGEESYELGLNSSVTGDDFDPQNAEIHLDTNGNSLYDPGVDTLYVPGSTSPPLLPADGAVTVFVVSDMPTSLSNGDIGLVELTVESVTAQATPGADSPGTVFAGQGDGGGNAVVGASGAAASGQNGYQSLQAEIAFNKSQSVADPFGGSAAVQGSVITYTLSFEANGSGDISNLVLSDDIPDNTTYIPGSITLNGADKTDTPGDDEAAFDAGSSPSHIEVDLGTVTAPATHTVTFQVQIN